MSMRDISIVPYHKEDYDSICRLLVESFQGKFHSLVTLDDEDMIELLSKTWLNGYEGASENQMVVKENGEMIGTIFLKWRDQDPTPRTTTTNLSYTTLYKQFGFFNVCKFLLGMGMLQYQPKQKECYIEHIAIHSKYRNQGIGKLVLAWAKDFYQHSKFEQLTLFVSAKNPAAIHLYEHAGFRIEATKYNAVRHFFFQEPYWHYMTWRDETSEKTY
ncbi:GNAT family N-acetyltransferase [Paenibacillus segetis]|uniref:N-acetyltransferase n=1 Tax=Paenibacillus segetis TaxID=1325360 RepID=A0ABQ1YFX1_9BACL|nr:GNAT family N-acetyltransferase [Paenibacillus segetis]GGH23578.1 N-acetyltransferase [Paenibacillus segetis]